MAWLDRGVCRRRHVALVEAAVWWVLLFAGYLTLVSPLSGGEFVLGTVLSLVAGGVGVLARQASGSSFAVSWRWLGPLLRIPGAVLTDSLLLARLLWTKREAPTMPLRSLPLARQTDEVRSESWQAVAGLMLSLSPGSFVIDSSGPPPKLLVHAIRRQPSAMERSVHR